MINHSIDLFFPPSFIHSKRAFEQSLNIISQNLPNIVIIHIPYFSNIYIRKVPKNPNEAVAGRRQGWRWNQSLQRFHEANNFQVPVRPRLLSFQVLDHTTYRTAHGQYFALRFIHRQQLNARKLSIMAAARYQDSTGTPTSSSGTSTPTLSASWNVPSSVSHAVTGLLRRFSSDPPGNHQKGTAIHSATYPLTSDSTSRSGVYTPPYRTSSPFQPPPLYPVILKGYRSGTSSSAQLLSRALAEEIRLLVPARLQLCEDWNLVYSLDQDGVSLGTLYKKCDDLRGLRNGFVLVVKDGDGGVCVLLLLY